MIRSKFFFKKHHFWNFSLTHKEEEVWPDGTHPTFFTESSCVSTPSFRFVAPSFFLAKVHFAFLNTEGDVA